MMDTTQRLRFTRPGAPPHPLYVSVTTCPNCKGEGSYEVQLPARSIVQEEPEYRDEPCGLCSRGLDRGDGFVHTIRCAACDKIVREDDIMDGADKDSEFEAALSKADPDELAFWQYHHEMSGVLREDIAFCHCADERLWAVNNVIRAVEYGAQSLLGIQQFLRDRELSMGAPGIHGVPGGVLLHLACERPTLWARHNAASTAIPYRVTADMLVVFPGHPYRLPLFSNDVHPEHREWGVHAEIADRAQDGF